jgi:hypothetical protein
MSNRKVSLIVDSGAFTAYTQNVNIDIADYAKFALANFQHIDAIVNLDVIGRGDYAQTAQEGWDNFLYLKDKGLRIMPVFHTGEPIKYLDYMIERADWIGLSTSNVTKISESDPWFNLMWDYITDENGYPVRNFHSFGDTTRNSILNYPWYSSDSSTWVQSGGMAARAFLGGKSVQFRPNMAKDALYISDQDTGIKKESWEAALYEKGLDAEKCTKDSMRSSDLMLIRSFINCKHFVEHEIQ